MLRPIQSNRGLDGKIYKKFIRAIKSAKQKGLLIQPLY